MLDQGTLDCVARLAAASLEHVHLQPQESLVMPLIPLTQLTQDEKEVLAQALMDYREGVGDNCDDDELRRHLMTILDTLEGKLGL